MHDYFVASSNSPETRILAAISGVWMSRLVGVANKLGVFELIGKEERRAVDIADQLGLLDDRLNRVLEGLTHLGFLHRNEDRFALTDQGKMMIPGSTGNFSDMAHLWYNLFDGAWTEIEECLKTDQSGFELHYGAPLFEKISEAPETVRQFNNAMQGLSQLIAGPASETIAARMKALDLKSICDIGGGCGLLINQIAQRLPDAEAILFDLPGVIEGIEPSTLEPNTSICAGSFFEAVPRADIHVLSNVIHDWSDEDALKILSNIRASQGTDSRIFLLEMMIEGDEEPLLARSTDLNMFILTGGRERTESQFRAFFNRIGYEVVTIQSIANLTCLLEAKPIP